MQENTEGGGRI